MEAERSREGREPGEGQPGRCRGAGGLRWACQSVERSEAFLCTAFFKGCTFNLLKSALGAEVGSCPECVLDRAVRF